VRTLAGRVAIVTGAGRGLGRAHALALAAEGARVVVNDVGCDVLGRGADPEVARAVVAEIQTAGGEAVASTEAVGTVAAGEALVRTAVEAFGRLDTLVNNAGITVSHALAEFLADDWERVLRVHLTGSFACARAAFAAMRAAGRGGRIINTTSGAALENVYPGTAAYAAAKGGVASLTRVIAAEGAAHGITCNAIAPLARTRMSGTFLAATEQDAEALDPMALGPLVVYLASAASGGVSGEIFRFRHGRIAVTRLTSGEGVAPAGACWTVEEIARRMSEILGRDA
jgi:NAD(P)-dependent dehydrogenase (short-subunit alcohol dehydrogenase family)